MDDNVIYRMVQVGVVTAVDPNGHKCRVKFPDNGLTSDWLRVLRQTPSVSIDDGGIHSHSASVSINNAGSHNHGVNVSGWMPKVNDTVVVIYIPVFNSDGFVIGAL